MFLAFTPAISPKSATAIRREMRSWRLHRRNDLPIEEIAKMVNPAVRGWINYYGSFRRSDL